MHAMIKLQDAIIEKKNGEQMESLEEQAALDSMLMKATRLIEQVIIDMSQD